MSLLCATIVAVSAVHAPPSNRSWWGDPATCHAPGQPGCEVCCEDVDVPAGTPPPGGFPTYSKNFFSGNCTGCVAPRDPVACANCFPGVRPWYNENDYLGSAGTPPKPPSCLPCSNCTIRVIDDWRTAMDWEQPTGGCQCEDNTSPAPGDCQSQAPGYLGCECFCNYHNQIKHYCGLDPSPATFPGPCVFDKMFNDTLGLPFTGECDADGYYKLVSCGPKAPPKLPPSPPPPSVAGFVPWPAAVAAPDGAATGVKGANKADNFCWCVEPTYGIQNGSSSVARGKVPNCQPTMQCNRFNKQMCSSLGSKWCNWTQIAFPGAPIGHYCADLYPGGPQ